MARSLIDSGATIVAGSHAHVFQGYERYSNGLILYDLGSFIFGDIIMETSAIQYKYLLCERKAREGIMVDCMFDHQGIVDYKFTGTLINSNFQATIPDGQRQQKIIKRFEKRSKIIKSRYYDMLYTYGYFLKFRIQLRLINAFRSMRAFVKGHINRFHVNPN